MPIASLQVGDEVLAYDEDTQQLAQYEVTHTWSHETEQLVYLTVDGELIRATANHPVYALGRGWLDAGALVPGDLLIEADGELGEVQALQAVAERAVVYNLTVADAQTYFVGVGAWWVHNCNRDALAAALGGTPNDHMQAHHIIPCQICDSNIPFVQAAIRGGSDIDGPGNGILLPDDDALGLAMGLPVHRGPHGNYTRDVLRAINDLNRQFTNRNWTDAQAAAQLQALADRLRQRILNMPAGQRLD